MRSAFSALLHNGQIALDTGAEIFKCFINSLFTCIFVHDCKLQSCWQFSSVLACQVEGVPERTLMFVYSDNGCGLQPELSSLLLGRCYARAPENH